MADLLPSTAHIPLPYVMGYDMRPLVTLQEKEVFLKEAADKNYTLFFEHDNMNELIIFYEGSKINAKTLEEAFKEILFIKFMDEY